ncbi:bifunctional folylpolyglutamate synthase/dihydrofolate synthase [Bacillus sp. JJ1474]|uniref:bifunctional folylpolyglutamate synthase/dihydrofolate synthase n=1 Tax=Bacillus sp. JJ1474 TaxID=3122955 RepID=UPI002FFF209C
MITAVKQEEALEVILEKAAEMKAPVYSLGNEIAIKDHTSTQTGEVFTQKTPFKVWENLEISMAGKHQTENAALAVMAAEVLNKFYSFLIEDEHLYSGLKKAYWPGRFEIMSKDPAIVIDGAHNEEGIAAFTNELKNRFSDKKINLIFTALADKKLDKMIENLDTIADKITFVEFDYPRAAKAKELFELSRNMNKDFNPDWKEAIKENISSLQDNEILAITGSLYFLSEMKPFLAKILKN